MTYQVLPRAAQDIVDIENWVNIHFGESASLKATSRLVATLELLARFQKLGTERPEIAPPSFRFYLEYPNWIIYRPGTPMTVHRIFAARMELTDCL